MNDRCPLVTGWCCGCPVVTPWCCDRGAVRARVGAQQWPASARTARGTVASKREGGLRSGRPRCARTAAPPTRQRSIPGGKGATHRCSHITARCSWWQGRNPHMFTYYSAVQLVARADTWLGLATILVLAPLRLPRYWGWPPTNVYLYIMYRGFLGHAFGADGFLAALRARAVRSQARVAAAEGLASRQLRLAVTLACNRAIGAWR